MSNHKSSGFTLIEVLISISIFSILSALAYGALNQSLSTSYKLSEKIDRNQAIQKGIRIIEQDLMQLAKRPIRSEIGNTEINALTTNKVNGYTVEFSRHGWANRLGSKRSTLQRVAYNHIDNKLIRYHWNVLDKTYSNQIDTNELFDNLDEVTFLFMKDNNEWIKEWPPIEVIQDESRTILPDAIKISFVFNDLGEIYRLLEIKR